MQIGDDLFTEGLETVLRPKDNPGFPYVLEPAMNRSVTLEMVDRADVIFHLAAAVTKVKCAGLLLDLAPEKAYPHPAELDFTGLKKAGSAQFNLCRSVGVEIAN